jgi:energy-coupling factor transporter ATP-binding protein EcfA2
MTTESPLIGKPVFIILHGPSGSGKTTIAAMMHFLLIRYGFNVRRDAFANPTRFFLRDIMGAPMYSDINRDQPHSQFMHVQPEGRAEMGEGFVAETIYRRESPREFMINLNAHLRALYGPAFFGRALINRVSSRDDFIIVEDGFANEAELRCIPNRTVIAVSRAGKEYRKEDNRSPFTKTPEFMIINNSSLVSLSTTVGEMVTQIIESWSKVNFREQEEKSDVHRN